MIRTRCKITISSVLFSLAAFSFIYCNSALVPCVYATEKDTAVDANKDVSLAARITNTPNTEELYSPISTSWFEQFQDKQLNTYIQQLINNNSELKNAETQIKSSELTNRFLHSSRWFPFHGPINIQHQSYTLASFQNGHTIKQEQSIPQQNVNSGLSIDYTNQYKSHIQAADIANAMDKVERDSLTVALISELADAYFAISRDDRKLELQSQLINNKSEQLNITRTLFELNLATQEDLVKLNEVLETYQSERNEISHDRVTNIEKILKLIAYRPDQGTVENSGFPKVDALNIHHPLEISSDEILKRQDVLLKYYSLQAAKNDINLKKKASFPNINMSAMLRRRNSILDKAFNINSTYYSLALSALSPFTSIPENRYRLKQSKLDYERAIEDYKLTVRDAFGEVHNLLYTMDKVDSKELAAENAKEERLKALSGLYLLDYEKGLRPKIDLLKLDESILNAQTSKLDKQFAYLQHCIQLYQSMGGHLASRSDLH